MGKVKCISDFRSFSGKIVFQSGQEYDISDTGIISNGKNYNVHYNDGLKEYFIKSK